MAHIDIAPDPRTVPVDGQAGGLLARTEPKVKAAAVAALLTPVALFYADGLAAGLHLPGVVLAVIDAVLTGAVTFGVGYLAKAADRIDLFAKPKLVKAEQVVKAGVAKVVGQPAADELETWLDTVAHDVTAPIAAQAAVAVEQVSAAAAAGVDPVVAARAQAPELLAAVRAAEDAARVAAESAATPVQAAITGELPAIVSAAASADPQVLRAKLQELIDLLGAPAPVADPVVAPVAPVTAEIPALSAVPVAVPAPAVVPVVPAPAGPVDAAVATVGQPPVPGSVPAAG